MIKNIFDKPEENVDIVNDPKYLQVLALLGTEAKNNNHKWLSYTKIYDFEKPIKAKIKNNQVSLPSKIESFMKELMKIGDEEQYGKYSVFDVAVSVEDGTNNATIILRGFFDANTEEECEQLWSDFKNLLEPLEIKSGVAYSSNAIRASWQ